MTLPTLSDEQTAAYDAICNWIEHGHEQTFWLTGYAGTGKTTLATAIAKNHRVAFGAFTGKATQVLRAKLHARQIEAPCGTLHSHIYTHQFDDQYGRPIFRRKSKDECAFGPGNVLIVDECSMIGRELMEDLLFFGAKILAIGDPGQLPPVGDDCWFTGRPDFHLSTIHRQALENPIIRASMEIREHGSFEAAPGFIDKIGSRNIPDEYLLESDQVLCGTNKMRTQVNRWFRESASIAAPLPIEGEKVVCLKNNHNIGVFNGGVHLCSAPATPKTLTTVELPIEVDGKTETLICDRAHFGSEKPTPTSHDSFDFGYCLTVHKSQGSEWPSILLIDDMQFVKDRDQRKKWLYTAVTRASERVVVAA